MCYNLLYHTNISYKSNAYNVNAITDMFSVDAYAYDKLPKINICICICINKNKSMIALTLHAFKPWIS